MKKNIFTCTVILFSVVNIFAQNFSRKYGDITTAELQMNAYQHDANAEAVILYENVEISYDVSSSISIIYDYKIKIKILTNEGSSWANSQVIIYDNTKIKETLHGLEAASYNMIDGRVKKVDLQNNYIFREKLDENSTAVKFSIPEVYAGSVIEYKYKIISNNIFQIPEINMQHSIPVMHSRFIITAPEYFSFNYFNAGYANINIKTKRGTGESNISTGSYKSNKFSTNIVWCEMENLPALKEEPHNWCIDDSKIKVEFEVSAISLPNGFFAKYTNTWKDVFNLLKYFGFNSDLKTSYPFKKEVTAIKTSNLTDIEKIRKVLKLVQSKIQWNGKYALTSKKLSNAIQKGEGTSAEVNFILHSALADAGFDVAPVLLNPRSFGRIPTSFPTINKIHTFIVKINLKNTQIFVDGTDIHSDVNVLPINLLVDRARIYKITDDSGLVNLTNLTKSTYFSTIIGDIDESGVFTGMISNKYTNQSAYYFAKEYEKHNSKENYIEYLEKERNIKIENIDIQGLDSTTITETIKFTCGVNLTNDYIYLNSLVFPFMSQNPFKQQKRILPVEFDFPVAYDIICNIRYPENYKIEEIPKNVKQSLNDNSMNYLYATQNVGNNLQMKFNFTIDKIVFPAARYNELRIFYGTIAQLSENQIVIKKN